MPSVRPVPLPAPARLERLAREYVRRRGLKLRHLAEGVAALSDLFVGRDGPPRGYMERPGWRHAYAVYYAPVNALKLAAILGEMRAYAGGWLAEEMDVLDLGCGPGTGLLGLLLAAGDSGAPLRYVGVDEVPALAEELELLEGLAREVWAPLRPFSARFRRLASGRARLVLALNLVSELSEPAGILGRLEARVQDGGFALLMEPATKEATRRVQDLRDEAVARGWKVAAPCPAVDSCPMRRRADLWCHADVPWEGMGTIRELDLRVGLAKESLKFSYLVLTRGGPTFGGAFPEARRLVSARHVEKGKMWGWMCGRAADLTRVEWLSRDRSDATRDFAHAARGDMLDGLELADRGAFARLSACRRVSRLALPRD